MGRVGAFLLWLFWSILLLLLLPLVPVIKAIFDFLRSRLWVMLTFLVVGATIIAGFLLLRWIEAPLGTTGQVYPLVIRPNDSGSDLRRSLTEAGLPTNRRLYNYFMDFAGADRQLQPGKYQVPGGLSHRQLANFFRHTAPELTRVTIREGLTVRQITPLLSRGIPTDSAGLVSLLRDAEFRRSLGIEAPSFEGFLFPETYSFYPYQAPREVIGEMVAMFRRSFTTGMAQRREQIKMSLLEVVTLASMIEAEAADGAERALISSVFHNRLRKGMKLQCDPTVIYALGGLDRPLLRADLTIDSPYNTYLYYGLPPGPIGAPGLASLEAALYPAETDYYYFVATGDGRHIFTSTLSQHNNAVSRAKRLQRQRR